MNFENGFGKGQKHLIAWKSALIANWPRMEAMDGMLNNRGNGGTAASRLAASVRAERIETIVAKHKSTYKY